jgi:hypothetical protein
MTKATERIVVFVTSAQKQAIVSTADRLGISVSELMRQAVQNFAASAQQVKVAALVDRMHQPKLVDPVTAALELPRPAQRAAKVAPRPAAQATAEDALPQESRVERSEESGQR